MNSIFVALVCIGMAGSLQAMAKIEISEKGQWDYLKRPTGIPAKTYCAAKKKNFTSEGLCIEECGSECSAPPMKVR